MNDENARSPEEWRVRLTPEQYRIARDGGTEPAFSGKYYEHKEAGVYLCVCCGQQLFASAAKFDSGSGWPSFVSPQREEAVTALRDSSHGMERTEVRCSRCDAHLGHVFEDGPGPNGLRYCVNSASLGFEPRAADEQGS